MASDQDKEGPWGDSAPGSATGRSGPSPRSSGVLGPSSEMDLPLSIFTAELDADTTPPHASVIDMGLGTSQPPINTPLRKRASTEFTGPIVTGASVLKHYLAHPSRQSAHPVQRGGRVEPAGSPSNNGALLSHTETMQSGGGGGTGALLSTLEIAQNVHRQTLFKMVKTTPRVGDTSRDEMGGDGDPSDSLGQLERLLVVLGMRVGSRSQAIWGVILLAFNTYRCLAAFVLAYQEGENSSLSCMAIVVGIFHLLNTLYQLYYFMFFPQTSLLRLYSNFVPSKGGSNGHLNGEEKRALRRELNALIRPLLPAIYMACIFNPITLILQYVILVMSENPATSLRLTLALTGYPWSSSFYSAATYWFFLIPITGIWLTSNLLFYIAGTLLLRHGRELIDDVRHGTVTLLDLWQRHHELCCAIRRADYLFSGYSDAHMALNGTMIIFIINALIFYDTTTFTKAMLVWYCVGTSALLGLWVVLAAATHSTHRTVLQQVLWGIDLEQWSQSDHSQLRTLLWKMTYTDPGLMLGRRKLKFTWQVAIRFASILTTAFVFVFQVYKIVALSGRMTLPEDPVLPKA